MSELSDTFMQITFLLWPWFLRVS